MTGIALPSLLNISDRYTLAESTRLLIIGGLFFLVVILFGIWILSGQYQKSVKRYISGSTNSALAKEKINHFIKNTPETDGLRYNHEFICGSYRGTIAFGETEKLAWIYPNVVRHKRFFATVDKSYVIVLGFTDGHLQVTEIDNESAVSEHIKKIATLCPQSIVGYNKDLHSLYEKELPKFLQLKYYKVISPDRI
ncbi:MAG: hypothetical protein IJX66_09380 [Lachnospiraceae bacterium]|nr:hypothetical protein [Lachnospiraceae bacterium]